MGMGGRERLGQGDRPHGRQQPDKGGRVSRVSRRHLLGAASERGDSDRRDEVTLNDTAPTTDRWNIAAVEVVPAVIDTQAPTSHRGPRATVTATSVPLSWTASRDDSGVAGYRVYRGASQVGDQTGRASAIRRRAVHQLHVHRQGLRRRRQPVAGVQSGLRHDAPPDTTAAHRIPHRAGRRRDGLGDGQRPGRRHRQSASPVQFLLDGNSLGARTRAPRSALLGHDGDRERGSQLAARAQDAAGNATTAAKVSVTVSNGSTVPPRSANGGPWSHCPRWRSTRRSPRRAILLFQGGFSQGGQQYVFDPPRQRVPTCRSHSRPVLRRSGRPRRRSRPGRRRNRDQRRRARAAPPTPPSTGRAIRGPTSRRCDTRAGTRPGRPSPTARCW